MKLPRSAVAGSVVATTLLLGGYHDPYLGPRIEYSASDYESFETDMRAGSLG